MVATAKEEGVFDDYADSSSLDGTTFAAFLNLNRTAYANTNDESQLVSQKSDEEKERTKKALLNQHFRLAMDYAFDRASYSEQRVGEDLKYNRLRNGYTPWDLVFTSKEVTVAINGTDTTFPAGTSYGELVQAQLDAAAELEAAIAELGEEGVVIDENNPIHIDITTNSSAQMYVNQANAYKQSVESALGGKVIVDISTVADFDTWGYAGFYCSYGYEMNYDMYDFAGWGPDYGDPSTFLGTMLADYNGYMVKNMGIF